MDRIHSWQRGQIQRAILRDLVECRTFDNDLASLSRLRSIGAPGVSLVKRSTFKQLSHRSARHRSERRTDALLLCCGVLALCAVHPAAAQVLNNGGFEGGTLNGFPGYGPVQSWSGSGLTGNNDATGPFNNGAPIREGSRVGFVQGNGSLSQTVTGLEPGKSYTVHYLENERGSPPGLFAPGSVTLGGQTVVPQHNVVRTDAYRRVQSQSFTATSTSHNLELSNALAPGDYTLLLDDVRVTRAVPQVVNGGFDDYILAPDTFQYTPNGQPGVGWSFVGGGRYLTQRQRLSRQSRERSTGVRRDRHRGQSVGVFARQ